MNREQYLAKRAELEGATQALINEGKIDEATAKMLDIEALDKQFEDICKAQANMNALKDNFVATNITAKSTKTDGETFESTTPDPVVDEKKNYLNAWAKVMMGQNLSGDERTVFDKINSAFQNVTQTAVTHAVVIPETVTSDIWKEAAELYPIIADLNMTYVPGDFTILKETSSGADGAWYDEATKTVDGDFAIGELRLTGCELSKAIPISWKLRKMSIERFIPYITSLLSEKMGAALAKGCVSGKGKPGAVDTFKPEPNGVLTALLAEVDTPQVIEYGDGGVGEAAALSYDIIAIAMGKVKSAYKSGAAIYAQSTVIWGKLALLKDADGRPLFIPDVTAGGIGRIFGLPVKEDDSVPADGILIGNIKRGYAINVNENMAIYTEDHIKDRYTDYMSYAIIDGDVKSTKAFAYIQKEVVG